MRGLKLSGYFQSPKIISVSIKLGTLTRIERTNPSKGLTLYYNQSKKLFPIRIHIRLLNYFSAFPANLSTLECGSRSYGLFHGLSDQG